jgi:mono/diheme cytochrome c family protein
LIRLTMPFSSCVAVVRLRIRADSDGPYLETRTMLSQLAPVQNLTPKQSQKRLSFPHNEWAPSRAGITAFTLAPTIAFVLLTVGSAWSQQMPPAKSEQEEVFEQNCNICHGNPATRAPTRQSLHAMSPNFIVEALTDGIMKAPGSALSPEQRVALAEFLTGKKVGAEAPMPGRCDESKMPPLSVNGPSYNGWGANPENWRYQKDPGISAAQLGQLELKWAFGFPGVVAVFGQPTVVGGRVYVGTQSGQV